MTEQQEPKWGKSFYKAQKFVKSTFSQSYVTSSWFSRYMFQYAVSSIESIKARDGKIDTADILDLHIKGEAESTPNLMKEFNRLYQERSKYYTDRGEEIDHVAVLKGTIWEMLKWDCYFNIANCVTGELIALFYSYYVSVMIRYINSPEREMTKALELVAIFFTAQVLS